MGIYYIRTEDDIYFELSSTKEIVASFTGQATEYPVESGVEVADNYVNKSARISFSGTISDIVVMGAGPAHVKTTQEYVEGLLLLKSTRRPFTVNWAGNLTPLDNCVFESLEIKQDPSRGWSKGKAAYAISFTATQIRYAEGAQLVSSVSEEDRDAFALLSGASGNTKGLAAGSIEKVTADGIAGKTEREKQRERADALRPWG